MMNYIKVISILLVLFYISSCDNASDLLNEHLESGPRIYSAKVDSMQLHSGYNRFRVNIFPSEDVNRSHCLVNWNITSEIKDSIRVDYVEDNYDNDLGCYYAIIDLSASEIEGNLFIELQNFDVFGNKSLKHSGGVYVYGATYASTLSNSKISFSDNVDEVFFEDRVGLAGNLFSYEQKNGEFTEEVFVTENRYPLLNVKLGGIVRNRSVYHITKTDIDTIEVSEYLETTITPYVKLDYNNVEPLDVFYPTYDKKNRDYDTYGFDPVTGIQNDANYYTESYGPNTLFNGTVEGNLFYASKFVKNLADNNPSTDELVHSIYSSYDLGCNLKLHKIKLFPRSTSHLTESTPKRIRIWGTDDANEHKFSKFPETWTLICELVGMEPDDPNNWTSEERNQLLNNYELMIADSNVNSEANPSKSFRYMRIEFVESYIKDKGFYTANEIELYGEIEEDLLN